MRNSKEENEELKIREYIINLNNDGFCIYAKTIEEAVSIFENYCYKYSKESNNRDFREYWSELYDVMKRKKYIIVENYDFYGVRRILN